MPDFHAAFAAALKSGNSTGLHAFAAAPAGSRFRVYRNNVVKGASDTLGDAYPAVRRLVGEKFFRGMAQAFWQDHPPRSRTLTLYGEGFAAFIAGFEPARTLEYLPDVARLDRAWLEAHHSADATPLTPDTARQYAPDELAALAPGLHPSVRVLASDYPAFSIWRTNRDDETVEKVALTRGGETALVYRPGMEVRYRRLSPAEALFLKCMARGDSFETASTAIADHFPGVEPVPVFISLLKDGVFNTPG